MKPRLRSYCTTATLLACAILLVSVVLCGVAVEFTGQFAGQNAAPPHPDNSASQPPNPVRQSPDPYTINWIQSGTVAVPDQFGGQQPVPSPQQEAPPNPQSPQSGSLIQTPDEPLNGSKWVWDYSHGGYGVISPGLSGRVASIKRIDDGLSIMKINTGDYQPPWVNVYPETVVQNASGTKADLVVGQSVRVLYGGIQYMTDPGQVDAQSISIEAE